MKDNQFNRDSTFAPMDEYTLLNDEEGAEVLHLNKNLQARVEELLYLHPEFDDEHVHVAETNGTVTLMGSVITKLDKNLAESLVMELVGVVNVINLLEIESSEPWMKSHEDENLTKGLF